MSCRPIADERVVERFDRSVRADRDKIGRVDDPVGRMDPPDAGADFFEVWSISNFMAHDLFGEGGERGHAADDRELHEETDEDDV